MPNGRGQVQHARLGGTRDGRITAYQLDVVQDAGAYPLVGAALPRMTLRMTTGVYDIGNVGFTGVSVVTNAVSTTAYRGAGRPEAAVAIERMVDRFAAEIGMDPAEVRRRNFVARFTEPYTTGIGTVYDVGDYPESLERALAAARLRRAARRAGAPTERRRPGRARHRRRHVRRDHRRAAEHRVRRGRAARRRWPARAQRGDAVRAGPRHDVGDDRRRRHRRADRSDRGRPRRHRRSSRPAGSPSGRGRCSSPAPRSPRRPPSSSTRPASGRRTASRPHVDDVVLDGAGASTSPARRRAAVGVGRPRRSDARRPLAAEHDFERRRCRRSRSAPTSPSSRSTPRRAAVRLRQHVAVDDAGTLINPLLAEGQVHGGIAQGVAQALLEAVALRRRRPAADHQLRRLPRDLGGRAAVVRARVDGDADVRQRRSAPRASASPGTIGVDPGRLQRGHRRAAATSASATSRRRSRRSGSGGRRSSRRR